MTYDMVYDMHIRCRTLQTYDIACIYKHTISYTLWIHCVVQYRMLHIRPWHRMLTYDIVYDIRYCIRYAHTISYNTDIRYRMNLLTYDIVYVMDSLCSTISYVIHTISHVDIRYRKNIMIRYRTLNIVCPRNQYRIYDIVYTIWYTTSNTVHTI
jgi:hypothetical protein